MSTITTINANDKISDSRAVINTNFSNLNTDKVEGQSASVDSEIALFSGTGGKTIKRSSTTGVLKATSGVIAAASAGTDYVSPSSSETLTNKTLTTPVINGAVTGTITPPKTFYGTNFNMPEGTMYNGKISPTVASNNLTVAIKTLAGTDPSATDPVYVMIGGTLRSITSALAATATAGTNYMNLGGAELATKETDLFVYLVWDTINSRVGMIVSRLAHATIESDFTWSVTAEKGVFAYADNTAGDAVVNIGRFAATLSAGAGYTWTVPTYTTSNLIQRPIYETRWLDWTPAYTSGGGAFTNAPATKKAKYKVGSINKVDINLSFQYHGTSGGSGTTNITLPFTVETTGTSYPSFSVCNYSANYAGSCNANSATLYMTKYDGNTMIANSQYCSINGFFEI